MPIAMNPCRHKASAAMLASIGPFQKACLCSVQTGKLSIADEIMISTYFLITVNFSGAIVILLLSDRDHIQRAMDVQWVCVAVQWICTPLTFVFAMFTGQPAFMWIILIAGCLCVFVVFAKRLPVLRLPPTPSAQTHPPPSSLRNMILGNYGVCMSDSCTGAGTSADSIWGATRLCEATTATSRACASCHLAALIQPQSCSFAIMLSIYLHQRNRNRCDTRASLTGTIEPHRYCAGLRRRWRDAAVREVKHVCPFAAAGRSTPYWQPRLCTPGQR